MLFVQIVRVLVLLLYQGKINVLHEEADALRNQVLAKGARWVIPRITLSTAFYSRNNGM